MAISEAELALIDSTYGIATGESSLSDTISVFLELQQDPIAALYYIDSIMNKVGESRVIAQDPAQGLLATALYEKHKAMSDAPKNPFIVAAFDDLIAGKIVSSDDLVCFDDLVKDEYYKLIWEPLAVRRAMGWIVAGRGQRWLMMGSGRPPQAGRHTRQQVERADLFRRHLSRAIHLQELLGDSRSARDLWEHSFQQLPYGIVLVDDQRRILFSNTKASTLLAERSGVQEAKGHFACGSSPHEDARFQSWWKLLVRSASEDGANYSVASAGNVREIEVSRVGNDTSQGEPRRRWLLTLKEQPEARELSISSLQDRFGLTRSEAHVCIHLCRNGDAVSTATAMGLSPNTVRTHLKSVFTKTGTRNQVELAIKLVGY